MQKLLMLTALLYVAVAPASVRADAVYHSLNSSNFSQNWSNAGLITSNDNWSGVPSIEGYRGDGLTSSTGVDPQTVLTFGASPIDVIANQSSTTITDGGLAEFAIANPTVAFQGSGTADAPFLIFYMNSTGRSGVTISYNLRDIDGSTDNAQQQVALQYRIGSTGDFTNVPVGYRSDASTGPSLAVLVTPVAATLPAWNNVAELQFRVITTNAIGNDEWIGVDDILITSVPEASAFLFGGLVCGVWGLALSCRRAVKSARAAV